MHTFVSMAGVPSHDSFVASNRAPSATLPPSAPTLCGHLGRHGRARVARVVGRHIGRHLPGNPTVTRQNMEGAVSYRAANFIYNGAPKDGTSIALISRDAPFGPLIIANPLLGARTDSLGGRRRQKRCGIDAAPASRSPRSPWSRSPRRATRSSMPCASIPWVQWTVALMTATLNANRRCSRAPADRRRVARCR
jgi:hypothetical protein